MVITGYFLISVFSCDKQEIQQLSEENNILKAELHTLETSYSQLKTEKQILEKKLNEISFMYVNQSVETGDLTEWTHQLVDSFGPGVWFFGDYDRPLPHIKMNNATPDLLIKTLNELFRESGDPEIRIISMSEESIDVGILNEEQLTQRMGSTGASAYMNAVFYTLTSLEKARCVEFHFAPGDHATPGKYCK